MPPRPPRAGGGLGVGNETDRLLAEARYWSTPPAPELAVSELLAIGEWREAQVGRFLEAVAAPLDQEERGALGQINGALRRFCQGRAIDAPGVQGTGCGMDRVIDGDTDGQATSGAIPRRARYFPATGPVGAVQDRLGLWDTADNHGSVSVDQGPPPGTYVEMLSFGT